MFAPTSPITGAAVVGLTSPTFTITSDTVRADGSKPYLVTALGGTQTGVLAHTPDTPFKIIGQKSPDKSLPAKNPVTGVRPGAVPKNVTKVRVDKSVIIDAVAGDRENMMIDIIMRVPAGAAAADPTSIKSAISAAMGLSLAQVLADSATLGQF